MRNMLNSDLSTIFNLSATTTWSQIELTTTPPRLHHVTPPDQDGNFLYLDFISCIKITILKI